MVQELQWYLLCSSEVPQEKLAKYFSISLNTPLGGVIAESVNMISYSSWKIVCIEDHHDIYI